MNYTIAAIPTNYSGVTFRSRLEAKWARFFDICGWTWSYEPFDLEGWIPDFLLGLKRPVLVEVKPYIATLDLVNEMAPKARLCAHDLVGVGSTLIPAGLLGSKALAFGVHLQPHSSDVVAYLTSRETHGTGVAQLLRCPVCNMATFYNSIHDPVCVTSGCDLTPFVLAPESVVVDRIFKMAGNDTQWKSPKKRKARRSFAQFASLPGAITRKSRITDEETPF